MLNDHEKRNLQRTAVEVRKNVIRMIRAGGSGHVGGALSIADVMTALYFRVMRVAPDDPRWPDRDRFVLSAGHKCLALYAVLAEKGFFNKSVLDSYGALNSPLPGHPDMHKLPGVEANTGALGHGLSIAGGMAKGLKMEGKTSRVFVVLGDGELGEGSNWEAASAIRHHHLDNLTCVVDRNKFQLSGRTADIMSSEPLDDRWSAFGWDVKVIDGHDFSAIVDALESTPRKPRTPSLIIADTVKTKGLSFAEDKAEFHHWKASPEELEEAERELAAAAGELDT